MSDALLAKLNELRIAVRETDLNGGELIKEINDITNVTFANAADGLVLAEVRAVLTELVTRFSRTAVKSVLAALTFSEFDAVQTVFERLDYSSGLIVSAKIAEETDLSRSVIVSALKKLETAGVIESRSLGVKGTHIKILNEIFIDELKKLG